MYKNSTSDFFFVSHSLFLLFFSFLFCSIFFFFVLSSIFHSSFTGTDINSKRKKKTKNAAFAFSLYSLQAFDGVNRYVPLCNCGAFSCTFVGIIINIIKTYTYNTYIVCTYRVLIELLLHLISLCFSPFFRFAFLLSLSTSCSIRIQCG